MIFRETKLKGAFIINLEKIKDERGFFARLFCKKEFKKNGLVSAFVQGNISYNKKKNTIRGMHFQRTPFEEVKLVRCIKGSIFDVIIDLRADSPTYKDWIAVKLIQENYKMLYIPEGFAHGYQTLEDNTEILYLVSEFYSPGYEHGVRWNDPAFGIKWPQVDNIIISKKDKSWPDYIK
jgi:dTDP-4-dehydrorhamnose 3,5-epimerase